MGNNNRVVVAGVDGSRPALAAARYAADLADRRGAALHLVHGYLHPFGYDTGLGTYAPFIPDPRADADTMLRDVAGAIRAAHPGLSVEPRPESGGGAAALIDASRHAEIVVVGSRGLGGFAGLLLGSVSAQVAAHAHCPVVVIRPSEPGETSPPAGAPVVVGVDGSPRCGPAIEFAFAEAAARDVPLVAVHVYWARALDSLQHPDADPEPVAREAATALLATAVGPYAAKHPRVALETRLVHSLNPEYALVEESRAASLVAVGSRGRGGFSGLMLGSVSQALVHHGHCPVAVVHGHEHRR